MKISELINEIEVFAENFDIENTCDTYKSGNADNEITGVGISMFATPDVIRMCVQKKINLLIVHEPVYYCHYDNEFSAIALEKKKLIEESEITIYRFHDHAHAITPDMIYEGELKYLGLSGQKIIMDTYAVNRYVLDNPLTAKELARIIEERLELKHIKIAGEPNKKGRNISCCFGTPGHLMEELENNDFVLTGEICEWEIGEMARDYAQLGYNKAVLVMGHIGSERAGMMYLADIVKKKHSELNIKYIECGEVYF